MSDDLIERIASQIERAYDSQQPRFNAGWGSRMQWANPVYLGDEPVPPYVSDSRRRDQWLRRAWKSEPHLAGVLNSVVLIDSNRGWELTGGRNQVSRYIQVLHGADGTGWRAFCRKLATSFWTTDMGGIVEIGRASANGPLRAMYHVDSARCRLTGDIREPLEYFPANGDIQRWRPEDYFRLVSMPNDDEAFNGLGFCAISRCIEIARVLYAVLMHDQEMLAARAPRGLLLLQNVSEEQWEQSLAVRNAKLDSLERRYYSGVQVLASIGADNIDAKLIGLSELPANFSAKTFTDLCMYAYAICFGYDPSEFWPVQFGSIGRGNETDVQHKKATGKGGLDFALTLQEALQAELPPTIEFNFEQRDDSGDLLAESVKQAKLDVIAQAYTSGLREGAPLLSLEEARQLLVTAGLIPREWTEETEEVTETDTDVFSKMDLFRVREAMRTFPNEQIITFAWPSGRTSVLYDPDRGYGPKGRRTFAITQGDVQKAIATGAQRLGQEFEGLLWTGSL